MSFTPMGIARIGSSQVGFPLFSVWVYNGSLVEINDSIANITADNYFADYAVLFTAGDIIHIKAIDGSTTLVLSEVIVGTEVIAASVKAKINVVSKTEIYTTVGGAVTEIIPLIGVVATDSILATVQNEGPNNQIAVAAIAGVDQVKLTFLADPGAGTIVAFQVFNN